jgi:hypothetical protein
VLAGRGVAGERVALRLGSGGQAQDARAGGGVLLGLAGELDGADRVVAVHHDLGAADEGEAGQVGVAAGVGVGDRAVGPAQGGGVVAGLLAHPAGVLGHSRGE